MTHVRVKGFKIFIDRHGKARCYHRATGHKVDLTKAPLGSAAFFAECERIAAFAEKTAATPAKPGTLGALIVETRKSDWWRDLGDRTRADYQWCADYLQPIASTPITRLSAPLIARILEKAAQSKGWRRANYIRSFLMGVFKVCVPLGYVAENYAEKVPQKRRPKDAPRANRPWRRDEVAAMLEHARPHIAAAVVLMANTGLDPCDAVRLRRDEVSGGVIRGLRSKTGQPVAVPITGDLQQALDRAPPHDAITVLATSNGTPWTVAGLRASFRQDRLCLEGEGLVDPGLTLKGLRHTVATFLREAGVSPRDIADLLGQRTESMALHYSDRSDLTEKNRATISVLHTGLKTGTDFVKPAEKASNPSQSNRSKK